jgi:hypothetical protein
MMKNGKGHNRQDISNQENAGMLACVLKSAG